jgi:hypothetical protein
MTSIGVQCVPSSRFPCSNRRICDRTWPDQGWGHTLSLSLSLRHRSCCSFRLLSQVRRVWPSESRVELATGH